jgi:tetrahydromethanopterin S-methyltransferase subunit G
MATMRDAWTDERLDDLNHRVKDGFREVDKRFDKVERDLHELRAEMTSRFDTTQHLIIQVGGGMLVAMMIGFLSIFVAVS